MLALPGSLFAQSPEQRIDRSPLLTQALRVARTTLADAPQLPAGPAVHATSPSGSTSLRLPIAIWAASVAADQTTTYLFSSRYQGVLHERNFLIRGLDQNPAALVAAGTAIDVATGYLAYRLLRNHPTLGKVIFLGAAGYRSYLAGYNIHMMQRANAVLATANAPAVR